VQQKHGLALPPLCARIEVEVMQWNIGCRVTPHSVSLLLNMLCVQVQEYVFLLLENIIRNPNSDFKLNR